MEHNTYSDGWDVGRPRQRTPHPRLRQRREAAAGIAVEA